VNPLYTLQPARINNHAPEAMVVGSPTQTICLRMDCGSDQPRKTRWPAEALLGVV